MPNSATQDDTIIRRFADEVYRKLASMVPGQLEEQLKTPVGRLLESFGEVLDLHVLTKSESPVGEVAGRPDLGVDVNGMLVGHVELKRPGIGADTSSLKGRDRQQWERFRALPNLLYTDGNSWALYRSGDRAGVPLYLGDLAAEGPEGLVEGGGQALRRVLIDFLTWHPTPPSSPARLAELLAPLCRWLRDEVLSAVKEPRSALAQLAADWREALFPDANDEQFSDAYAQTLTYALLLARFDGGERPGLANAAETLDEHHGLLAQALRVLGDPLARKELATGLGILERVIASVDPDRLAGWSPDPWLYFYEYFLAAYDARLREERGVYYTPVQVVRCQVRLVADLLSDKLGKAKSYADDGIVLLDPAAGTGTYPLAALEHGIKVIREHYGPGAVPGRVDIMARNIHAFEILVGPYAVAHLRLTQAIREAGGSLPADGPKVYLTDTLESPDVAPPERLPLVLRRLGEEHERAREVKANVRVLVCMGNPPYNRHAFVSRKGSDDSVARLDRLLGDFFRLARGRTMFSHLASLYNDYVYFWRWALRKVFAPSGGAGVASFITASSYLQAPGFLGMREVMRRTFDELWILDLGGEGRGAVKEENVFSIKTPVAIAVGVRYGKARPDTPSKVHYTNIEGTRAEKYSALDSVQSFRSLQWQEVEGGWTDPFRPRVQTPFSTWPLLSDLFPWQTPGVKAGRTWPIAPTEGAARRRWDMLAASPRDRRAELFVDPKYGRSSTTRVSARLPPAASKDRIIEVTEKSPRPPVVRYGYRSFVRHWLIADPRVINLPRPPLWYSHSPHQLYMTSLLTKPLGVGPAVTATTLIPDLDHFSNRGGKDVVPLYRDAKGHEPNVTGGLLRWLSSRLGFEVDEQDLLAYCYALLSCPSYTTRFAQELQTPDVRVPLTRDPEVFLSGITVGKRLLWIHSYGERYVPEGERAGRIPRGQARAARAVPTDPAEYPGEFSWDEKSETLYVGTGAFRPVRRDVWEFQVSGLRPLRSWLGYRMRRRVGRRSSPLDDVRPESWPAEYNDELLELLWLLEHTVEMAPLLEEALDAATTGAVFSAGELPQPAEQERKGPEAVRPRDVVDDRQVALDY
ncbi:MAG: N-6 DNA methylase [Actinomycetota bacterium]|nr:N-6 DNA methylase [Actinomycetota bacterium]